MGMTGGGMPGGGSRLPGEPLTLGFAETLAWKRSSGYSQEPCCLFFQNLPVYVSTVCIQGDCETLRREGGE